MAHTAAVQILININGKSLTLSNQKKNVVSLKVSRVLGDAANKFTLELFDETAWKLESALYKTGLTPISITYGATAEWANNKHITFTGMCTNYNLSFVGQATMLSIEGVIYAVKGVNGSSTTNFWFKKETVNWCDTTFTEPVNQDIYKLGIDRSLYRRMCSVDGKNAFGETDTDTSTGITRNYDEGYQYAENDKYDERICARIEWLPPSYVNDKGETIEVTASGHWEYRILVNPTNIFKRIIRKYNGEIGASYKEMSRDFGGEDVAAQETWFRNATEGYGNFEIHPTEVDESLWVDATNLNLTQTNTTAADFITNTLCKIAVSPETNEAGFNYYIKDGKHCFKAIDYSSKAVDKIVHTGYFTKESDVISFSLNQSGAMVMAGAENDPDTNEPLVDIAAIDSITGQMITSEKYYAEGKYIAESKMTEKDTNVNPTNWYFRKVSSAKVVSSGNQNLLDITTGDAFEKISSFVLSASMTIWGEYNNKYVPGNYVDITVMTPDGKKHYSSGKYFILSADDSVTSDGYTTTLKLFKGLDSKKSDSEVKSERYTATNFKAGTFGYGNINPFETSEAENAGGSGDVAFINGVTSGSVAEQLWSTLKANGFSDAAAAGMMGNAQQESSMNPTSQGAAIGLFQFEVSTGNASAYKKFAASQGKEWTDVSCQLQYLLSQLENAFNSYTGIGPHYFNTGEWCWWPTKMTLGQFKALSDPENAAEIFERVYERASIPMIANRKAYARQYYNQFHK